MMHISGTLQQKRSSSTAFAVLDDLNKIRDACSELVGNNTSRSAALAIHLGLACGGKNAHNFRLAAAEAANGLLGLGSGASGNVGFRLGAAIFLCHGGIYLLVNVSKLRATAGTMYASAMCRFFE